MGRRRLSAAAAADIEAIARASERRWGFDRAEAYLLDLDKALDAIAAFPEVGRDASAVRPGARRLDHEEHVVFYRRAADGIFVLRVLHRRMLPERHL